MSPGRFPRCIGLPEAARPPGGFLLHKYILQNRLTWAGRWTKVEQSCSGVVRLERYEGIFPDAKYI